MSSSTEGVTGAPPTRSPNRAARIRMLRRRKEWNSSPAALKHSSERCIGRRGPQAPRLRALLAQGYRRHRRVVCRSGARTLRELPRELWGIAGGECRGFNRLGQRAGASKSSGGCADRQSTQNRRRPVLLPLIGDASNSIDSQSGILARPT